jgi:CRISPR-associated protein Cas1
MIFYLVEPGSYLRKNGGKYIVEKDEKTVEEIPSAKVESIVVYKGTTVSTAVYEECLSNGVPLLYVDYSIRCQGRLESLNHHNIERHMVQFERYQDEEFSLELDKKIIYGKLRNGIVVLRRYNRNQLIPEVKSIINQMSIYEKMLDRANTISELSGYEGSFSKLFFEGLSYLTCDDFKFQGRSKRPPKDPFNGLLSFGYTLLYNEIYTALIGKGLNPFVGVMHRIKNGHAALASDLMEEWRAVMVDSFVLNLVNGGTFKAVDFSWSSNNGIYLCWEDRKTFIQRFETRLRKKVKYILDINAPLSFRESIQHQIYMFTQALEQKNPDLYNPIIIR